MAKAPSKTTRSERPERPKRVPMNGSVDILEVGKKDPDHEYRWVSDNKKGRLQRFDGAWWDKVSHKDVQVALGAENHSDGSSSHVVTRVGTHADGSPEMGYLMRIPKKFYEEDQKAKQDAISAVEQSQLQSDGSYEKGQYGEVKLGATRSK